MTLLIDIGNSRVKWASLHDGVLGPVHAAAYGNRPFDELWDDLFRTRPGPNRVVVANVAGDAIEAELASWSRRVWDRAIESLQTTGCAGTVRNGYVDPDRLGVDRWLAMIGARAGMSGALCVVDCGTALTVDAVDTEGLHLGGWIAPGIGVMQGLLLETTHGVHMDTVVESGTGIFGRDTTACVRAGTCQAAAGLVFQALSLQQTMTGEVPRCVVTGGDASVLLPLLPPNTVHIPELVLRGIAAVAQEPDAGMRG